MNVTRRGFLGGAIGAAAAAAAALSGSGSKRVDDALVNHVGFAPAAAKYCLWPGAKAIPFTVAEATTGRAAFSGTMLPAAADLGRYVVGDFGQLTRPGRYRVVCTAGQSGTFEVGNEVYTAAVRQCVEYFARQRCGDSTTGHHAPCHLDDGRRSDDGRHQDVVGGWHDACDLRKWVNATVYGMLGLSQILECLGSGRVDRDHVVEELRWGNRYFHKMQAPAGYVMDYCGGDDGNRYTDNRPGTADDRPIHVEPCELPAQFQFIAAQAAAARHTGGADPAYAQTCERAAARCLEWCVAKRSPGAAATLGAAVAACTRLHQLGGGGERLKNLVAEYTGRLLSLQVTTDRGHPAAPLRGFFMAAPDRPEPYREIMHGNLPLLGLCEALEGFADHADAAGWRRALRLHADYLLALTDRSAFGVVPFGLYFGPDPGGGRGLNKGWYRYFMKRRDDNGKASSWWVGVNAHLASTGVGLARAARLLGDDRLARAAQRQLDWILGVNPFNASTVSGVGRNQPPLFATGEFRPATPLIPGGVMNGIGGSDTDEPRLEPGSYHTCEYWSPMVAYTMWLMAECQHAAAPG
jgi:hypothetical protein